MTAVTFTYLANAQIGFGLDMSTAIIIGGVATTTAVIGFFYKFGGTSVSDTDNATTGN